MKDIPNYEGLYSITEDGQVWSYRKKRFLKPYDNGIGYQTVSLFKDKIGKQLLVHRLVAITYIPNPNNYPEVNHKDEKKWHNEVSNLEWCDHIYNNNYGTRNQRMGNTKRSKALSDIRSQTK